MKEKTTAVTQTSDINGVQLIAGVACFWLHAAEGFFANSDVAIYKRE